ncbi:MAG TPA: hypothetical protein VH969_23515 [Actinophytocola sp.]|jgi:hypothetical protein|uniref:DUF7455 domain-containing protein n=1 Tax=Actinophytocola sp. TaxID=1872138 RepID=UPI002F9598FD
MTAATAPHVAADMFHAEDRCDRCSAAAHVLVLLNAGGELVFCRHHANEHRARLAPIALIIEHQEPTH